MTEIKNISAVVSLQHVVANFLNEVGDYTQTSFQQWLQVAIRGFSNIAMTSIRSYKTIRMTPDSKGQVRFPDDFVDYAKIGCILDGELYVLSKNENLIINSEEENGDIVNESYGEVLNEPFNTFYLEDPLGFYVTTPAYGASYSNRTQPAFNIDYENKVIQLSSSIYAQELVIEYISTGVSLNGNTYIPRYVEEPLLEFLHWRRRKNDSKYSRGEVMDSKQDYLEAVMVMETFEKMPTYQEIMDALYETSKQTIKR